MKRRTFEAMLIGPAGVMSTTQTFAWNSAVKASEELVRKVARTNRLIFTGDTARVTGKPAAPGTVYVRDWASGERWVTTIVREVRAA